VRKVFRRADAKTRHRNWNGVSVSIGATLQNPLSNFPKLFLVGNKMSAANLSMIGTWNGHAVLEFRGRPNDASAAACQSNTNLLSYMLQYNASNNVFRIARVNETYYFYPGIYAHHLHDTVVLLDGTMRFERPSRNEQDAASEGDSASKGESSTSSQHTVRAGRRPEPCWMLDRSRNVTLTSSSSSLRGLVDGRGSQYWGVPGIGFLQLAEHRPRLLQINLTSNLRLSHWILQDSPYHTVYLEAVENVTIHDVSIVARRTPLDGHGVIDLTAFNTDGIDVSGTNVHVHDVDIWTQDDCIAVKDNTLIAPLYESTNMLFERVNCSGLGFVIGSIGGSTVRNITFRNSYLHKSVKGIYLKFRTRGDFWTERNLTGVIQDVTFENITMEQPLQWPIWMGPAQQSDERRPCVARPCSLCWPHNPAAECRAVVGTVYRNIALRNVQINNPIMSPGVILGGTSNNDNNGAVIDQVLFDNVRVTQGPPIVPVDRTISFPGLLQPIDDHYVPKTNQVLWMKSAFTAPNWGDNELSSGDTVNNALNDSSTQSRNGHFGLLVIGFVVWHVLLLLVCRRARLAGTATDGRFGYKALNTASTLRLNDSDDEDQDASEEWSNADSDCHFLNAKAGKSSGPFRVVSPTGHFLGTMLLVIVELILIVLFVKAVLEQFSWNTTPKWNRIDQYFRCQGVTNGVATGGTWPVPSCFVNANKRHHF
jgi:Glycosyl hydrolases family 28